jgi:TATA-binding protein-associated factor Taf7
MQRNQFVKLPFVRDLIKKHDAEDWQCSDGLTPPMKSATSKMFLSPGGIPSRHTRGQEMSSLRLLEDIDRKVRSLLERDACAKVSTFQVCEAATGRLLVTGADGKVTRHDGPDDATSVVTAGALDEAASQMTREEDEEITLSARDQDNESHRTTVVEEEDDDDDFAAELEEEIMMALDKGVSSTSRPSHAASLPENQVSIPVTNAVEREDDGGFCPMSAADRELLKKIEERKGQLASLTNPLIRARLEEVIKDLENTLAQRRRF